MDTIEMWRKGPYRCVLLFGPPDESCTLQLLDHGRIVRQEDFRTTDDCARTAIIWLDAQWDHADRLFDLR